MSGLFHYRSTRRTAIRLAKKTAKRNQRFLFLFAGFIAVSLVGAWEHGYLPPANQWADFSARVIAISWFFAAVIETTMGAYAFAFEVYFAFLQRYMKMDSFLAPAEKITKKLATALALPKKARKILWLVAMPFAVVVPLLAMLMPVIIASKAMAEIVFIYYDFIANSGWLMATVVWLGAVLLKAAYGRIRPTGEDEEETEQAKLRRS